MHKCAFLKKTSHTAKKLTNRILHFLDLLNAWKVKLSMWPFRLINKFSHSKYTFPHLITKQDRNSKLFSNLFGEERKQNIIDAAEEIIMNRFTIFLKTKIFADNCIDWQKDYISERKYSNRYYRYIPIINKNTPIDPKIPWELSRFHHGLCLGQAFDLSGESKYTDYFANIYIDWYRNNPWKFGINWTCSMEVALRAFNWIAAFEFLHETDALNALSAKFIKKNFRHHLDFIIKNLEWSESATTNHYLSNLLGIIAICAYFPSLRGAAEKEKFAYSEFEKEILKQFYEDGGNYESSSTYQRFVTEIIFFIVLLAERRGYTFSNTFRQRIKNSVILLNSLANSGGKIPQFGDNDSGRILPFAARDDTDVRHLGALFGLLYNDPELINKNWEFPEEAYWIFGEEGNKKYKALIKYSNNKYSSSKKFPDAGWYIMRSGDVQVSISASPNGQSGYGGHCHNDKLFFTLSIGNHEIITDPGTYTYSSDLSIRREFRSTKSHSTLMIDNEEQNRYIPKAVFWVHNDAKVRVLEWQSTHEFDMFIGEHSGYTRLGGEVMHRRSFIFDKQKRALMILDEIFNKKPADITREATISFVFPKDDVQEYNPVPPQFFYNSAFKRWNSQKNSERCKKKGFAIHTPNHRLSGVISSLSFFNSHFEDCWISNSYLSKYKGKVFRYKTKAILPIKIFSYLWVEKV